MSDIETLAGEVARSLSAARGEQWTQGEGWDSGQRRLHGPDGAALFISYDYRSPARVSVSGEMPRTDRPLGRHHVTAAASRGAEGIAGDVARRLLPGYLADLATARERNAAVVANWEGRAQALDLVAGLFGARFHRYDAVHEIGVTPDRDVYRLPDHLSGTVEATGDPRTLDVRLRNVPADVARCMLAVLAERCPA